MTWWRKTRTPAPAASPRPVPGKNPVPGNAATAPTAAAPVPPFRQPPAPGYPPRPCPSCGARQAYTVTVWQCDRTHLYDGAGVIAGATPCQPDRPDLLDLEIRDLYLREEG